MTVSVKTKNGHLLIHEDQRLILDRGGEFSDAVTNGKYIIALLRNGRVQEFRLDGQFTRDIVSADAIGIKLADSVLTVKTSKGGFDQYKDGKRIYSSGSNLAPKTGSNTSETHKKRSNTSETHKLGERLGDILVDKLEILIRTWFKKLKGKYWKK